MLNIYLVLVLIDHFVWFNYFTKYYFPFDEIVCFFVICVWAVPFEFFISLSANDNTLPYGNISQLYLNIVLLIKKFYMYTY